MSKSKKIDDFTNAKKLVKNIVKRLYENELEYETKYRFVCHNEFDSNTTKFEALSNARLIVVKTKLSGKILILLMRAFQCIYDKNYYPFFDDDIFCDLECPFSYNDIKILNILDPENYVTYMAYFLNLYYEEEQISKCGAKYVGENEIYDKLPTPNYSYAHRDQQEFEQKVYTIKEILDLIFI